MRLLPYRRHALLGTLEVCKLGSQICDLVVLHLEAEPQLTDFLDLGKFSKVRHTIHFWK
jgi:hypothetical protein